MRGTKKFFTLLLALVLAAGALPAAAAAANTGFVDVPDGAYYADAVVWAVEEGITKGAGDGRFDLAGTLAYDQIFTFLCRFAGERADGDDWSAAAVSWANSSGLTDGLLFSAKDDCPRSDVVYCLYKQLGDGEDDIGQAQEEQDPAAPEQPDLSDEEGATLANGQPITDENIQAILYSLQDSYPEGMRWTNDDRYYSTAVNVTGLGCEGFALICSDAVFGDMPVTSRHSDFDAVRVGDLLRINNNTHTVIVLEKRSDSVIVAEGNSTAPFTGAGRSAASPWRTAISPCAPATPPNAAGGRSPFPNAEIPAIGRDLFRCQCMFVPLENLRFSKYEIIFELHTGTSRGAPRPHKPFFEI